MALPSPASLSLRRRFLCVRALLVLLGAGCGDGDAEARNPPPTLPLPTRTAAEDDALRTLLLDLAASRLCDELTFLPVPDDPLGPGPGSASAPTIGRLWARDCTAEVDDGELALALGGLGWTWIDESQAGPFGTRFSARGHLGFEFDVRVTGALDTAYDAEARVLSVWLTPTEAAEASISPRRTVAVTPNGDWSNLVAAVGSFLGTSVSSAASPALRREGGARMRERLSHGFTFTLNMCSGQSDVLVGPLANGETPGRPFDVDAPWLTNERVRLRPGGLDALGPWNLAGATLQLEIEVEEGSGVVVDAYCEDDATAAIEAFAENGRMPREPPLTTHRAPIGTSRTALTASCPLVLLARSADGPSTYRVLATPVGGEADPPLRCTPTGGR